MREFVKLSPRFWSGKTGRQLRKAGIDAQLVALYLLSCPSVNYIGLYRLPVPYIAADTGLDVGEVSEALARIEEVGFAKYDDESETVWVLEAARRQVGDSLKRADNNVKNVQREFDAVPNDSPFKADFLAKYGTAYHIGDSGRAERASEQVEHQRELDDNI